MLKIINKNDNKVSYILTEGERISIASKESKELIENKINNIERYVDTNIDFFTDKEVEEENKWCFYVNKNNKIYTCIYDNEHVSDNNIEKEARYLLMWRHGDNGSYVETIGDYIENNIVYTAKNEIGYNECEEWIIDKNKNGYYNNKEFEKIELNTLNMEEVKKSILSY